MNLLISLRSEMFKTRRTATFYFTVIAAALIPFIFLLDVIVDGVSDDNRKDAFNSFVREGFVMLGVAILPMYIILMCTLLAQIEYRNNTWKQVFASPQRISNIFIARFLNVQLLLLFFLLLFNVFMGMVATVIHFADPELKILNQPFNSSGWLMWNVNYYLAVLAMCAIQFWLGLRFRNFLLSVGIGFVMWLIGTLLVMEFKTSKAFLFPYTYLPCTIMPKYKSLMPLVHWCSVGYMVLFLGIGYFDFRRMGK